MPQNSDWFLWGFMACVVVMLAMFSLDAPHLTALDPIPSASSALSPPPPSTTDLPLHDPPRPHLTKEIERLAHRDQFELTGQSCEKNLCVSCFVSYDFRHLLGEMWTYCDPYRPCELLDTNDLLTKYGAKFGACERHEVPPIDEGE